MPHNFNSRKKHYEKKDRIGRKTNKTKYPISLFNIFSNLYRLYKKNRMEVLGCYSSVLKNANISTNLISKKNIILSTSGGISNDEAQILYMITQNYNPKNILIIGNSYGFSAVFLSLSLPNAKLVAFDKFRTRGIKVTKNILKNYKNKFIIKASTPEDLKKIALKYFNNSIDFVLIDAVHTNEMQTKEFTILQKSLSLESIVVFHDVLSCNLLDSFNYLKKKYSKKGKFFILNKTSTGMGLFISKKLLNREMYDFLKYFNTDEKKLFEYKIWDLKNNCDMKKSYFNNIKIKLNSLPHPQK
jgi:predicted O-methyltransferase YrrM